MSSLPPDCRPKLSQGCNLSQDSTSQPVILVPEGIIKLKGSGVEILKLCNGELSLREITLALKKKYNGDEAKIMSDVQMFLIKLVEKKIVTIL